MTTTEPFVDVRAVAELIGKDRQWIWDNQARLDIPRYRLGNQYRYRLSEVAEWLSHHRIGAGR